MPASKHQRMISKIKKLREENVVLRKQLSELKRGQSKNSFYTSPAWLALRYKALVVLGRKCMCCGVSNTELHVDHIKPRTSHPNLELDFNNLQILCRACNLGKRDRDSIRWEKQ